MARWVPATTRALREHRAQAGHQGIAHGRAAVWRPRRCRGYLVGEENRGLEYMFIMMNAARYAVGMQGIAISERAYQKAVQYAKDRAKPPCGWQHRRQRAHHSPPRCEAHADDHARHGGRLPRHGHRGGCAFDAAHHHPDADTRKQNQAANSWCRWSRATAPRPAWR